MEYPATKNGPFDRFLQHQEHMYAVALEELQQGQKHSCWMWFIFPQLRILARSRKAFVFGIIDLEYARMYLHHPVLGPRLIACCQAMLTHQDKTAEEILGEVDALKLRACATLFSLVSREDSVFHQILHQFYGGRRDALTLSFASGRILDFTYRKFSPWQ